MCRVLGKTCSIASEAACAVAFDGGDTADYAGVMIDPAGEDATDGEGTGHGADALLSRLRVIEDQPLESRAEAFAQVHEEFRRALEGGDTPAST